MSTELDALMWGLNWTEGHLMGKVSFLPPSLPSVLPFSFFVFRENVKTVKLYCLKPNEISPLFLSSCVGDFEPII